MPNSLIHCLNDAPGVGRLNLSTAWLTVMTTAIGAQPDARPIVARGQPCFRTKRQRLIPIGHDVMQGDAPIVWSLWFVIRAHDRPNFHNPGFASQKT